jgi:hypothetical protein
MINVKGVCRYSCHNCHSRLYGLTRNGARRIVALIREDVHLETERMKHLQFHYSFIDAQDDKS